MLAFSISFFPCLHHHRKRPVVLQPVCRPHPRSLWWAHLSCPSSFVAKARRRPFFSPTSALKSTAGTPLWRITMRHCPRWPGQTTRFRDRPPSPRLRRAPAVLVVRCIHRSHPHPLCPIHMSSQAPAHSGRLHSTMDLAFLGCAAPAKDPRQTLNLRRTDHTRAGVRARVRQR